MKSDSGIDQLAEIAARGIERSSVLEEQLPATLPDLAFPAMECGPAAAFAPRHAGTPERLRGEMEAARLQMAGFLDELAPPLARTRKVLRVERADWRLEPSEQWSEVSLPHYGGPIGRARAWYRMRVNLTREEMTTGSLWACFAGVDYKAAVFFNGELAGTHEGFFSPFEFNITKAAREGENELLVRVDNDAICMGNNSWDDSRAGDKIYGATGLGWDEPGLGWHHCPPGMGIHRPVRVECRPKVFLHDIFVRPLPEEHSAEAWIEVFQTDERAQPIRLAARVHPANFRGANFDAEIPTDLPQADSGVNRYRICIPMPDARRWSPEEPWMYNLQVTLDADGVHDRAETEFGFRSFQLDESPGPDGRRGRFLLNGQPIRLRGANTMGHEQQCVFQGNLDQLRDDILLAKLANMNFLRFTQRPVEPEVYRMCDRLGMMAQTDLPLFAYLRRNQFCEAVRQSAEMERLIRRHPSNVLISFINEPFPATWGDKSHRHLTRTELENFFTAAAAAIRVENPDRQIKPIDGDYEPPGPGLPDNHCYTGWYNGHGIELGKLHKGYWLPVKPGWNYACGEFGSEGLDFEEVMRTRYPAKWIPDPAKGTADESAWTPARIHKAQTGTHYHFWFEPGTSMAEWIARSQAHQEWITRLMTEAFRRDNRMISFAIHLFIDAWPAGWMKTIMDCRRKPKPAYFAYREALAPLAVFLRMDRTVYWAGELAEAEVWICNDRNEIPDGLELALQLCDGPSVLASVRAPTCIRPCEAVFQARVSFEVPPLPAGIARRTFRLEAGLVADGQTLHDSAIEIDGLVRPAAPSATAEVIGTSGHDVAAWLPAHWVVVSDPSGWNALVGRVREGATALLLGWPAGTYMIDGSEVVVESCEMEARHFVARNPQHPAMRNFRETDFRFWHDAALDRPSPLLHRLFFADGDWTPILGTGQLGWGKPARPALVAAERRVGDGRVIFCQLELAGRLTNPAAILFLTAIAEGC